MRLLSSDRQTFQILTSHWLNITYRLFSFHTWYANLWKSNKIKQNLLVCNLHHDWLHPNFFFLFLLLHKINMYTHTRMYQNNWAEGRRNSNPETGSQVSLASFCYFWKSVPTCPPLQTQAHLRGEIFAFSPKPSCLGLHHWRILPAAGGNTLLLPFFFLWGDLKGL